MAGGLRPAAALHCTPTCPTASRSVAAAATNLGDGGNALALSLGVVILAGLFFAAL